MKSENMSIAIAVAACSTLYVVFTRIASLESKLALLESKQALLESNQDSIWRMNSIPQILNCATKILQWVIAQQPKKHSSSAFGESFGS